MFFFSCLFWKYLFKITTTIIILFVKRYTYSIICDKFNKSGKEQNQVEVTQNATTQKSLFEPAACHRGFTSIEKALSTPRPLSEGSCKNEPQQVTPQQNFQVLPAEHPSSALFLFYFFSALPRELWKQRPGKGNFIYCLHFCFAKLLKRKRVS